VDEFGSVQIENLAAGGSAPITPTEWRFDDSDAASAWKAGIGVEGLTTRDGRLRGRATTDFPLVRVERTSGLEDEDILHEVVVRAIHEDPTGTLWIGTLGEGLFAMEPETGLLRSYRSRSQDPSSLASDSVSSIVADRRGVLWVGTSKGLDELELSTFRFRHHKSVPSDPRTLSGDAIHSLLLEPDGGRLWVGTAKGSTSWTRQRESSPERR
jgi:streptogramin lyase